MTFQARQGYQLNLSVLEAAKLDKAKHTRLRNSHRLNLTLDLDHTLIHSTNEQQYAHLVGHPALADAPLHSFQLSGRRYFTKERPGLKAFLAAAKQHFELHVDTAGTRPYAEQIVAAIDPTGEFFGSPPRIVARTDSGKLSKQTSWLHGSLLDDSMVLVLDDTEAVWRGSPVLLLVDPYHYFQGTQEVNNAAGASVALPGAEAAPALQEAAAMDPIPHPHGVEEGRPHLLDALKVFNTVHRAFFSCYGVDLPASQYKHGVVTHALDSAVEAGLAGVKALQEGSGGRGGGAAAAGNQLNSRDHMMHAAYLMQRFCQTILRGVVLVFSGVFPIGTKAHREVLYRRAVAYGATVADTVTDKTTHVVCRAWGTAKARQAEKLKSVRVVKTAWLQDCIRQYRRVPEGRYVFPEAAAAGCGSKPHPYAAQSASRADAHFNQYFTRMLGEWRAKQAGHLRPPSPPAAAEAKRARLQEDSDSGDEIDMDLLGDALDSSGDEETGDDDAGKGGGIAGNTDAAAMGTPPLAGQGEEEYEGGTVVTDGDAYFSRYDQEDGDGGDQGGEWGAEDAGDRMRRWTCTADGEEEEEGDEVGDEWSGGGDGF